MDGVHVLIGTGERGLAGVIRTNQVGRYVGQGGSLFQVGNL